MSSSIDFDEYKDDPEPVGGTGLFSESVDSRSYPLPADALFCQVPYGKISTTSQRHYLVDDRNASLIIAAWGGGISQQSEECLSGFVLANASEHHVFVDDHAEFTEIQKAKRTATTYYTLEDWYRNMQNLLRGDPIIPGDLDSRFLIACAILFKVDIQQRYAPDPEAQINLKRVIQLPPKTLKQWQSAASSQEGVVMQSPFSFAEYDDGIWLYPGNVQLRLYGKGVCPRPIEHIYPSGQYVLTDAGQSIGQQVFHIKLMRNGLKDRLYHYMLNQAYLYFLGKYLAPYDERYKKPMEYRGYIDQRPNHNMAHAIRTMFNAVRVVKLFAEFAKERGLRSFCENLLKKQDNVAGSESDELVLIKVLALAVSTGRMDEFSRTENPLGYQLAKIKAGNIVVEFLEQFPGLMSDEQIAQYQYLIVHVCNPKYKELKEIPKELVFVWLILSFAHDADLRRCYSASAYRKATSDKYVVELEESDAAKTALEAMLKEAIQAVNLTGMGLCGEDMVADFDKFMLCAQFPKICITVLSERPDLVLPISWRDILSSDHPVSDFHEAYKYAAYYTGLEAVVFRHCDNLLLLDQEDKLALSAQQFNLAGTHFLKVLDIVDCTSLGGIYSFARDDEGFRGYLERAIANGFIIINHGSLLIGYYLRLLCVLNALLEVENPSEASRKSWLDLFDVTFVDMYPKAELIDLSTNKVFKIELAKRMFLSDKNGLSRLIKYVTRIKGLDYVALGLFLAALLPLYEDNEDYDAPSVYIVKNLVVLVQVAQGQLAITTEIAGVINSAFETDQLRDIGFDMFSGFLTTLLSFDPSIDWQYIHDNCPAFMQFILSKQKIHHVLPPIKLHAKYICSCICRILTYSEEDFAATIEKFKIAPFYLLPEHFNPCTYKNFPESKRQFVLCCFELPGALVQFCKAIQKVKIGGGYRNNYYKLFVDTIYCEVVRELNEYQEALMLAYHEGCFSTPNTTSDANPIKHVANGLIGDAEGVRQYLLNPTEFGGRGRANTFNEKHPEVFKLLTSGKCSLAVAAIVFAEVRAVAGSGAPEAIRTPDLSLRRGLLYPAELPGQL